MLLVRSDRSDSYASVQNSSCKHILILGLGYAGSALANYIAHSQPGWTVTGTTRGTRKDGIKYPIYDGVKVLEHVDFRPESIYSWESYCGDFGLVSHIVSTIPPPRTTLQHGPCDDPVLESIIRHDGSATFPQVEWIGYMSTTRVYGNRQGSPVWEDSEITDFGDSGSRQRFVVEQQWLHRANAHIFRCGGIYGPYRSVLDTLRTSLGNGKQLSEQQKARRRRAATFRCHVYDVCQSIEHSMQRPHPRAVYNIVDDDACSRRDVENYAYTRYFGYKTPPSRDNDGPLLPPEKMVMNTRMKKELHVCLEYPTYKHGLDALALHNDLRPFTYK